MFVFGDERAWSGRGSLDLDEDVDIHLGTFSKSLGGQGGYTDREPQADQLSTGLQPLALLQLRAGADGGGGSAGSA